MLNTTKQCTQCKEIKTLSEYSKRSTGVLGVYSKCKKCKSLNASLYRRTKKGICSKIYGSQRASSRSRGHIMPSYTNSELFLWITKNDDFENIYSNWVKSGYRKNLVPSCDRLDDSKPYSLDNIQLVTWEENNNKAYSDMRSGKLTHGNKPHRAVNQYTKDMVLINTFVSTKSASRNTIASQANISNACLNKRKYAGGFIWRYKT